MFLEPSRTLQLLRRLRAFWSLGMSVTPRLKPEVASSASSTYLFWDQQQVKVSYCSVMMGADLRQSCKQLYLQRHLEPKKDMLYSKGYLWRRSICGYHNYLYVGVLESWDKVLHFKEAVFTYKSHEDLKTPHSVGSGL
ncbi:unnamed protein product [Prunus armeniaca]|uniref:Uncharacterized protein n=1 Tax=Prunus armeniaca TaxID=36596 RepID=A0A6J5X7M9_PRUAR|nr:unnamed protein product [Prunus armeniaca]